MNRTTDQQFVYGRIEDVDNRYVAAFIELAVIWRSQHDKHVLYAIFDLKNSPLKCGTDVLFGILPEGVLTVLLYDILNAIINSCIFKEFKVEYFHLSSLFLL